MLQPPSRNCIARVCCDITKNDCCLFMGWNYRNMAFFRLVNYYDLSVSTFTWKHIINIYIYICTHVHNISIIYIYICTYVPWHLLWTLILRGWPISYFTKRSECLKWVINRLHQDESMYICIHACMHTDRQTYIHTLTHTYIHTYLPTYIHTFIHTLIHTYISTYIH